MQQQISTRNISVTWRGKKFILEMNLAATLKDLAYELQKLTDVKADTMRLIVPQSSEKSSKLLSPFSEEHSGLSLQETFFFQAKSVRMMGVPKDEVDEILQNAKANLRIAGFEEEENRLRQRMSNRPHSSLKLPQGQYIFCEFRTLHLPGVELDPPASEALRRMHMLAADPGIVAIMNKHRWRVGIMTEMAPVGYVGVSPKCILGFNKNQGEEISLRLRTDDLKGFRKYESIKKTLFHELAHMVYSEHDADFFALDKQLNQEAAALDWTRSKGHRLTGVNHSANYEEFWDHDGVNHSANYEEFWDHDHATSSQKLGGKKHDQLASARATSVAAAYERLANVSQIVTDHDSEDFGVGAHQEPESMDVVEIEKLNVENSDYAPWKDDDEPNPDDCSNRPYKLEPDPDDIEGGDAMESEPYSESTEGIIISEPDPDDSQMTQFLPPVTEREIARSKPHEEPDPDDSEASNETVDEPDPDDSKEEQKQMGCRSIARHDQGGVVASHMTESTEGIIISEPDPDDSQMTQFLPPVTEREIARSKPHEEPDPDDSEASNKTVDEPDPDDSKEEQKQMGCRNIAIPDQGGVVASHITETQIHLSRDDKNPDGDDYQAKGVMPINPRTQTDESYSDDQEIQRIQDPVTMICTRLQKAIVMLQSEVSTTEIAGVLQTLFRIIRNLIEHPSEIKFKRIRKDNPLIQRNVTNYKAAMEILTLIGFIEDVVLDEIGRAQTYLVLKRNDPGLLWLAKSSLETCIAY